mmetsp:Transcript_20151/g.30034  ORF Transcript_20151/g.30034 Transcript_20151/m.30034 type:complete len:462 (-) Transcript_20151:33-1418(-)|eukprot:CAMPEP_0116020022 /NCGR_PEP_ID=MMETSP0321-20121206/9563_1 /TAXON_ID=163516 /ORGANISM="Leptocylindrus danicus var. danicus, Strain B650" /LENGTH=461 /DNA_ID=CAMNT_0003490661 /DNA_START=49 /DNA_END=1434 /DNA_ORIENTATION=+
MEKRSLDVDIQHSSITIQLKNEPLVLSLIGRRKVNDLEQELSRLVFDWVSKISCGSFVKRDRGEDSENNNILIQNDDRWVKIEEHMKWAKERSDHAVSLCRAANDVVSRNADILNKAILSQTLRHTESRHDSEISLLLHSLETASKELAQSKDENHVLGVQLSSTKNDFELSRTTLAEVQRSLKEVTLEHSACQKIGHGLRRQLSEKQASELHLNHTIQDLRRQNCNQEEQINAFHESEESFKNTIFQLKQTIKSLEQEIQQKLDAEQTQRSATVCCPHCSNGSPKRKGAKRRMKVRNRLETTNKSAESADGKESMRSIQRRNKTLEQTVRNAHEKIDKLNGELETCNKQRDFYRTLLRGKNISQLVNKVAAAEDSGQFCQICHGRIDVGRPFSDPGNSFSSGSSLTLPELNDHRGQFHSSFGRKSTCSRKQVMAQTYRKGSIEDIMQKRALEVEEVNNNT